MAVIDHGIPVVTARQWMTALSPNAANTDWNYIVQLGSGGPSTNGTEFVVVKNLTTAPSPVAFEPPWTNRVYGNTNFQYANQLRDANGRIFFPQEQLYMGYYDPTTESVGFFGPVVETPPTSPNAATLLYSNCFDVTGLQLYSATQESQFRQSCVVVTDTVTLAQTVLGYVGDSAAAYTTYGYSVAPDTGTATKFVYVVYGEDPWQLWALNITPGPSFGVATKLAEVSSVGHISFLQPTTTNPVNSGWVAKIQDGSGGIVNKWCIDGVLYDYVPGVAPPSPRAVAFSNPIAVGAPALDTKAGGGVVGWRNGTSGPFTYVNYPVDANKTVPQQIESLVASSSVTNGTGIVGNAASYQGLFQNFEPADTTTWYGTEGLDVSEGPRININNVVYLAGYPNGVLISYDPASPYLVSTNPLTLGNYGLGGTLYAGIKYATCVAWGPLAGSAGRLYCAGQRERNGVGSGIGSYDMVTKAFAGTYAATGMTTCLPETGGLCVISSLGYVVMSTHLITPPGTANLYVFDYNFNLIATPPVIAGLAALGPIFETKTPGLITGMVQGSGNSIGLWQFNLNTMAFVQYVELPIIGAFGGSCQRFGGSVWLISGNNLVKIDITALTAAVITDLTAQQPINRMAFSADSTTLFFTGATNSGITGAQLFSYNIGDLIAAGAGTGVGVGTDAVLKANGTIILVAGSGTGVGLGDPVSLAHSAGVPPQIGGNVMQLLNDESTTATRGTPVYSSGDKAVRFALGVSGLSRVIGIVSDATIPFQDFGSVTVDGTIVATTAEWDAVCGTNGGLASGTTYYLHPTIPGRMTSVPTSTAGTELVAVMRAIDATTAILLLLPPISM